MTWSLGTGVPQPPAQNEVNRNTNRPNLVHTGLAPFTE
jgi:hypothetical protein